MTSIDKTDNQHLVWRALAGAALLALLALVAASSAHAGTRHRSAASVRLGDTRYGRIIVDRHRRTLYLFTKERRGRSECYDACARAWSPYLAGKGPLRAGPGLRRALLGTTRRKDGTRQITYAGHPLYHFVSERRPGDVFCQDVTEYGGDWLIVDPDGTAHLGS